MLLHAAEVGIDIQRRVGESDRLIISRRRNVLLMLIVIHLKMIMMRLQHLKLRLLLLRLVLLLLHQGRGVGWESLSHGYGGK